MQSCGTRTGHGTDLPRYCPLSHRPQGSRWPSCMDAKGLVARQNGWRQAGGLEPLGYDVDALEVRPEPCGVQGHQLFGPVPVRSRLILLVGVGAREHPTMPGHMTAKSGNETL